MEYKLSENLEKIVEPPFSFIKFNNAVLEIIKAIETVDELNALDNYMNVHVLASWISDHEYEIAVLPNSSEEGKREFMSFIQMFGRNGGTHSMFNTHNSNQTSGNGTLVRTKDIFVDDVPVSEIYEMDENAQDPYCEKIVEILSAYKGRINTQWYRGSIQMTPPHHCEQE